ncbi:MAG: phospholipase D-like domain-containing protein [Candidatus Eremiobacteraeota bacterium]|nr:phospholipase D-like domain-containing protein [Candidatus Eremiobacteraeota bacterium]
MKKFCALLVLALLLSQIAVNAQSASAGSAHRLIAEPDDGRNALLYMLDNAKETITLTIYEIDDPEINAALIRAVKRGVKVQILYNYYSFLSMGREYRLEPVLSAFKTAGIQLRRAPQQFTVTHQKTFTVDGKTSLVMSFNLQPNYFGATRDFAIITTVPGEVGEIARVFEADWNARDIVPEVSSLVWSPVNSRQKLLALIAGATKTLDIYNEEAEDREILQALTDAAKRGVKVRFISAQLGERGIDRNQEGRDFLNAHGVTAKCVTSLYIHAKMILADFSTPAAQAFVGSENFSWTSLDRNRELGVLVTEEEILERLHATFETDWAKQ